MRDRTEADDIVQGATNRALLDLILPPMRRAAKAKGYAIAVHGSLNRDIDLVAIPWIDAAKDADTLLTSLCGAIAGVTGNCNKEAAWTPKPHGRVARLCTVYCGENHTQLDVSVMPTLDAPKSDA